MPALELRQKVDAVLARHSVVADDEIERSRVNGCQSTVHVGRSLHQVTLAFQDSLNRFPANSIIVCD
jgi:hypothetical protein